MGSVEHGTLWISQLYLRFCVQVDILNLSLCFFTETHLLDKSYSSFTRGNEKITFAQQAWCWHAFGVRDWFHHTTHLCRILCNFMELYVWFLNYVCVCCVYPEYVHNGIYAASNTYHLLISTSHESTLEAVCLESPRGKLVKHTCSPGFSHTHAT